ncbi:hypothetical protein [Ammonifex thiophilus]|uniref:Uncharacterized protein n=1 Tax=Ammonifex thiophilus TaxID=444093 RepID=A0A3D8P6U8_9THEO|nr:hypothetical protein [Ammonifex thiophilus]RDV84582.1 hypothetical protein DXX99_00575 [Ammonifex thiophilus]
MPDGLEVAVEYVQVALAAGRGTRQMANLDRHGFPREQRSGKKLYFGFAVLSSSSVLTAGGTKSLRLRRFPPRTLRWGLQAELEDGESQNKRRG